jgi:hypothetical protein
MNRRCLHFLSLALVACFLTAAVVASAASKGRIIEGRKVGSVTLGMTKSQVKQRFGRPDDASPDSWLYVTKRLRVSFKGNRLSEVVLFKRNFVTRKGIGIGSGPPAIRRAYPGAKCFLKEGSVPGAPVCVLRSRLKGKRTETYFRLSPTPKPRVWEVSLRFGCLVCRR